METETIETIEPQTKKKVLYQLQTKHFVSLSIFQVMTMFRRGIFYFFLSIYLKEFLGVSNTEMTLFATLPMIVNIVAQSALWGRISDRFKKRRLLIIFGETYAAIGYLVVFWIHKSVGTNNSLRAAAFVIIIGFTVIEAGWSSSNLGWSTLIADLTKDAERSKVMGRLQFVGGIGNVLGVTASGFLYASGLGFWDGSLFYISSGIMVFSIVALFLIPESYADLEEQIEENNVKQEINSDLSLRNRKKPTSIWNWKLFVWLIIIVAIVNIGGNSIGQMIQIYTRLPDTFAASDIVIAQLRNTSSIAMIIAGLAIGFFTTRFGDDRMLLIGFSLVFIATISLPFASSIVIYFIYMALKGTSRVWIQTTSYAMVTRVVPLERRGRMMGYYNAAFFLAWGLGGTILTGPVADAIVASNSVIIMIYTIMILVIIGLLIYLLSQKILQVKKKKYLNLSWLIGFIILFSTGIAFLAKPITNAIIVSRISDPYLYLSSLSSYANSVMASVTDFGLDAYAYIVTFYIASLIAAIGIIAYLFLRPSNYKQFKLRKHISEEVI